MTDGFTPRPAFPVRSGSVPARPAFPIARGEPVVDVTLDRDQEAKRAIEAVVLAATEPVEPRVLAELVELPVARVEQLCTQLAAEYDDDRRGFVLARVAGGYRFQTHPDLAPYVEHFVLEGQHVRLSGAALETLAIVAYKQPISRGQISAIRGVNVESTLSTLIQRGYVEESGHDPGPGTRRPLRHDDVVPRTPGPRLARATCRRSATSSPTRASSRRSNAGCVSPTTPRWARRRMHPSSQPNPTAERGEPERVERERVQKVLARAGFGSRRACEELIAAGRVTVDGRTVILGDRIDVATQQLAVDGVPVVDADRPRVLPAQQAGAGRHHRARPRGPADGGRAGAGRAAGRSRSADSTSTPRGCSCSRTTATSRSCSRTRATGSRRSTSPRWTACPAAATLRRLREGVELDDGVTAPARVRILARRRRRRRARDRDPRGPQPPGPADVRGRRASGSPTGPDAHRSRPRRPPRAGGVAGAARP